MPDIDDLAQYLAELSGGGMQQQPTPLGVPPPAIPIRNSPFVTPPMVGGQGPAYQQIQQAIQRDPNAIAQGAGSTFDTTMGGAPEQDDDIKAYIKKLMDRHFGQQNKREAELSKLPKDYEAELRAGYYGPDPKNPVAKNAKSALMLIGGILGAPQPDFRGQAFDIWKNRQKQLSDEQTADKALILGQLNAATQLKKTESQEQMKYTQFKAQYLGTALKDSIANAQNQLKLFQLAQQQGVLDAKEFATYAKGLEDQIDAKHKELMGVMGAEFAKMSPAAQITFLNSRGMKEEAKQLAQVDAAREALKASLKGGSASQGSTTVTKQPPILTGYDNQGMPMYRPQEDKVSTRIPNAAGAQTGPGTPAAQAAMQQFQQAAGGGAPAAPVAPMPQQQSPAMTPNPFSAPPPPQVAPQRPAPQQARPVLQPDSDIPPGTRKVEPLTPNLGSNDEHIRGWMGYADGAPIVAGKAMASDRLRTDAAKKTLAALEAQGAKASSAATGFLKGEEFQGIIARFMNMVKDNRGYTMKMLIGDSDPKDLARIFQTQAAETQTVIDKERDVFGMRGGAAGVEKVKALFPTNTMNPETYVQAAMFNSLMNNSRQVLNDFHIKDVDTSDLAEYMANRSQQTMKFLKQVQQQTSAPMNKKRTDKGWTDWVASKEQELKQNLDPRKVLSEYLQMKHPGQSEFVGSDGTHVYHLQVGPKRKKAAGGGSALEGLSNRLRGGTKRMEDEDEEE